MDDDRKTGGAGDLDLLPEDCHLHVPRCIVSVEIEADLTVPDDLGVGENPFDFLLDSIGVFGGIVGVYAYGTEYTGVGFGNLDNVREIPPFGTYREHRGDALPESSSDDGLSISIVFVHFQMAVRIDEHVEFIA